MKKVLILVSILTLFLYGCSQKETEMERIEREKESSQSEEVQESSSSEVAISSSIESSDESEAQNEITPEEWAIGITETLGGESKAIYDEEENSIKVYIRDDEMVNYIHKAKFRLVPRDSWYELVEEYRKISETITETTGRTDLWLTFTDPFNPDKNIIVVNNGVVLYDVMEGN